LQFKNDLGNFINEKLKATAMKYPGRVVIKGEKDKAVVKAVQKQLNEQGCGPIDVDGDFGPKTFAAVKLFQSRFPDQNGNPLVVDGKLGPLSWSALFGESTVPINPEAQSVLLKKVLEIAKTQIGELEKPKGSNWGKPVEDYLKSVGLNFPAAWCAAFVYWCFQQACDELGKKNPVHKTAGVLNHWNNTSGKKITTAQASANPALVKPGQIFILSSGGGFGHTGLVESVNGGFLVTIEGNTNEGGSREGIGVFRRNRRKIKDINRGFIHY